MTGWRWIGAGSESGRRKAGAGRGRRRLSEPSLASNTSGTGRFTRTGAAGFAGLVLGLVPGVAIAQQGLVEIVASHAGSSDALRMRVDPVAPQIEILSPADGSVVAGNTIRVSGIASDSDSDSDSDPAIRRTPLFGEAHWSLRDEHFIELDSGSAPIVEGRFTIADLVLGSGSHRIEVTAVDAAGNVGSDLISLTSDPEAAPVRLIGIEDGEALLGSSASIDLNFAEPTTLVSVSGAPDGRSFPSGLHPDVLRLPLEIGPNRFILELESGAGPFSLSFTLFRVESREPIRILSPADGALTRERAIDVAGTVPRGTPFAEVDGQPATLLADGVRFSARVPLREGRNEIEARALPFGQRDRIAVTLDTLPPALEALFPIDGTRTTETSVALSGFLSEGGSVSASGPGGSVETDTQTRILAPGNPLLGQDPRVEVVFELPPLPLIEGVNAVDLRLTDRAGNETLEPLTLLHSERALALESPAPGSALDGLRADLTLRAFEDVELESVSAGGRRIPDFDGLLLPAGPGPPSLVTLGGLPLIPGVQEIRLVYRRTATGEQEVLSFELESRATDTANVVGTVTDVQTGAPLEGALVSAFVAGRELVVPTGPEGRFALRVEPGEVRVVVRREGFAERVVEGMPFAGETLVADAELLPWSVVASPAPAPPPPAPAPAPEPSAPPPATTSSVAGTIREEGTGAPLEGALVRVHQDEHAQSAITDAAGGYELHGIPAGPFEIAISRVGFFPQAFTSEAHDPGLLPLDVALRPVPDTVTLVGRLIDRSTGDHLPGVRVDVLQTPVEGVSDEQGEFVLQAFPTGEQTLRFRRLGSRDVYRVVDLEPDAAGHPIELRFEIELLAGRMGGRAVPPGFTGRVYDGLSLEPLAGIRVEARSVPTPGASSAPLSDPLSEPAGPVVATTVSNLDGDFTFTDLPPFETLEIEASADSHEPQSLSVLVVPRGEGTLEFHLRSLTEARVGGSIVDADTGEPISLAEVRLVDGFLAAASDVDGSYQLLSIPPGSRRLEVVHPAYLSQTVTVDLTADAEARLDFALEPRPKTGGITGIVRERATNAPIPGAIVSGPGGAVDTTDADGRYHLPRLPTGLVRLSIEADGFPTQARFVIVDADRSASESTLREVDLLLTNDGSLLIETEVEIPMTGGVVELPDESFRLDLPPLSLSGDARVRVRRLESPLPVPGAPLDLDPDLGLPELIGLGGGVQISLESTVPGAPAPVFVGPVLVSFRYSAAHADAFGIEEQGLVPVYFDPDRSVWTLLSVIPHLHAVDRVNRRMVAGLSAILTEAGGPVTAGLETPEPAQVAGFTDLPVVRQVRQLVFGIAGGIKRVFVNTQTGDLLFPEPDAFDLLDVKPWQQNSRPLFVFHGWDPRTLLISARPMTLEDLLEPNTRYREIVQDLMRATDGVYRPVFATYNSRMGLESIGNLFRTKVLQNGKALSGFRPDPDDPHAGGRFPDFDAFGFSMGGLAERAYQTQADPDGRFGTMVTMGTPHHGALQLTRLALSGGLFGEFGLLGLPGIELLIERWSPGTADLFDYSDTVCDAGGPAELLSGNPTLCRLNKNVRSAPLRQIRLIAGTRARGLSDLYDDFEKLFAGTELAGAVRSIESVLLDPEIFGVDVNPLDELISQGFLAGGCLPSDGVVCAWSAHGRRGRGGEFVRAFADQVAGGPALRDFDHHNGGGPDQPIAAYRDQDITPYLSDWLVANPVSDLDFQPPTPDAPGSARFEVTLEFNAHRGVIEAAVLVLYGGYLDAQGQLQWKILAGADEEGEPDEDPSLFVETLGNSVRGDDIPLRAATSLARIDPTDPSTGIRIVQPSIVPIGPSQPRVPLAPTGEAFALAPGQP